MLCDVAFIQVLQQLTDALHGGLGPRPRLGEMAQRDPKDVERRWGEHRDTHHPTWGNIAQVHLP